VCLSCASPVYFTLRSLITIHVHASQNTGPLRSSGHKQPTESCDGRQDEDAGALYRDLFPFIMDSHTSPQGDNADPEALLQNRILSNQQVSRAAFYDHDDSLCAASSTSRFKLAPDDIRKVRPLLISQAMDWLINDLSIDPRWASDLRRLQVELGSLRST